MESRFRQKVSEFIGSYAEYFAPPGDGWPDLCVCPLNENIPIFFIEFKRYKNKGHGIMDNQEDIIDFLRSRGTRVLVLAGDEPWKDTLIDIFRGVDI